MSNSENIQKMKDIASKYKFYILMFIVIAFILVILFYISYKISLKTQNCKTITKYTNAIPGNTLSITSTFNNPLHNYFIKICF